jgi:DnaJ like chaperone protein
MGSFSKYLGASLGWSFGGPIGAIIGFILGTIVDEVGGGNIRIEGPSRGSGGFGNPRRRSTRQRRTTNTTQSGDFEMSLLVLSAVVIKADGKIDQKELSYVRNHFKKMYGETRAKHAFKLFNGIIKKNDISTRQVCLQIRQQMTHASRLQLMHYLFNIAKADGFVTESELNLIEKIAGYLYISTRDFESIKAMFYSGIKNAYKVLEIDRSVTDAEVKKAYRRLVKKHHPDKLQHLGKEHLKGAEEKFRQIQKAYEDIKKERNL